LVGCGQDEWKLRGSVDEPVDEPVVEFVDGPVDGVDWSGLRRRRRDHEYAARAQIPENV
jgi:hypothetical protein